jgi:DNA polymerase-3 subunit epsilon
MTWVAFDTETTGLEPGSRIVEIAAVAFDDTGAVLGRFARLMRPGMPIPPDAASVHGIDSQRVVDAPDEVVAIGDFLAWLPTDAVMIAHNAGYDQDVVTCSCQRLGFMPPAGHEVVDTLVMARRADQGGGHGLGELVRRYGLPLAGPLHRAEADAEAVRLCFLHLRQQTDPVLRPWMGRWQHPAVLPEIVAALPELVAQGRPVACLYQSSTERTKLHDLVPYGWAALAGGRLLLHGLSRGVGHRLSFRIDRIVGFSPGENVA